MFDRTRGPTRSATFSANGAVRAQQPHRYFRRDRVRTWFRLHAPADPRRTCRPHRRGGGHALLHEAIDAGVDYIDTAYFYHAPQFGQAGQSEPFLGRALSGGWRDRVSLTTKLPVHILHAPEQMETFLAEHQPSARWRRSHGSVAIKDPRLCKMCHAEKFCSDCHGLAMPHPAGWAQRAGHPAAAQVNRAVCERCHGTGPDLCTMCHHKAYAPDRGPWVQQHPAAVRTDGLERCLKCHGAAFCANCHVEAASR